MIPLAATFAAIGRIVGPELLNVAQSALSGAGNAIRGGTAAASSVAKTTATSAMGTARAAQSAEVGMGQMLGNFKKYSNDDILNMMRNRIGGAGGGSGSGGNGGAGDDDQDENNPRRAGLELGKVFNQTKGHLKALLEAIGVASIISTYHKLIRSAIETAEALKEISAPIAQIFAQIKAREIQRGQWLGQRLAPTYQRFANAQQNLKDQWAQLLLPFQKVAITISTGFMAFTTQCLRIVNIFFAAISKVVGAAVQQLAPLASFVSSTVQWVLGKINSFITWIEEKLGMFIPAPGATNAEEWIRQIARGGLQRRPARQFD